MQITPNMAKKRIAALQPTYVEIKRPYGSDRHRIIGFNVAYTEVKLRVLEAAPNRSIVAPISDVTFFAS